MLGFLLARAGIEVLVLEKHADFMRDFRGDTVHPSTLETMHELDLLEELLKRPHQKVDQVRARIGGESILLGNMSYLRTRCRFFLMMPQWDFLDFLAEQGRRYPTFHLRMQSEVSGLIEDQNRIAGVRGDTPAGPIEVRADLVVGADGRNSVVRDCSGLAVQDLGAPTDALWMRLCRLLRKQVCFCTPVLTAFITSCQDAIAKGNTDQSTWTGAGPNKRALRGIDTGLGEQHLRHHSFWGAIFLQAMNEGHSNLSGRVACHNLRIRSARRTA